METFKIVSDSSCDIPSSLIAKYDLELVPYYVSLDRINYLRENIDISVNDFYAALKADKLFPKTSLPPIADYCDIFQKWLEKGQDIMCICLTSKFSGSYQSAINAKNMLLEEYPNRKIVVVDSQQVTQGQGVLVLEAAKLRDANATIEETEKIINKMKINSIILFTVDSLDYLQRGGRIGKATALAGSLLNIKPIVSVKDGELNPYAKVRGRKKAILELTQSILSLADGKTDDYIFGVVHADCLEEGKALKQVLMTEHSLNIELPIFQLGVTIGTHAGPTTLGITMVPKNK